MFVSTANTVALNLGEVQAALATRVPLAEIPQTTKGNLLELQFRNPSERDEWVAILENAFDSYMHDTLPLANLPDVPSTEPPAPMPRRVSIVAVIGWTFLGCSAIVITLLALARFIKF